MYFFEVIDCGRRLALAAMIGIVSADSAASPVLGLLISLAFTFVFVSYKPFKENDDSKLSIVLAYSLALVFISALLIKADVTSDDEDDQKLFGVLLAITPFAGPIVIALQLLASAPLGMKSKKTEGTEKKETAAVAPGKKNKPAAGEAEANQRASKIPGATPLRKSSTGAVDKTRLETSI